MRRLFALALSMAMLLSLGACGSQTADNAQTTVEQTQQNEATTTTATAHADHSDIENALDLKNMGQEWMYTEDADAWVLSGDTASGTLPSTTMRR